MNHEGKSSSQQKFPRATGLGLLWITGCFLIQTYLTWSVPEAEFNAPHNVAQRKAVIAAMFIGVVLSMYGASRESKISPTEYKAQ